MTNEMIERVAAAMADGAWSKVGRSDKEYWRGRARIAIETMRSPTLRMALRGHIGIWETMIDAVLKDD